jgi:hypothetical protein
MGFPCLNSQLKHSLNTSFLNTVQTPTTYDYIIHIKHGYTYGWASVNWDPLYTRLSWLDTIWMEIIWLKYITKSTFSKYITYATLCLLCYVLCRFGQVRKNFDFCLSNLGKNVMSLMGPKENNTNTRRNLLCRSSLHDRVKKIFITMYIIWNISGLKIGKAVLKFIL